MVFFDELSLLRAVHRIRRFFQGLSQNIEAERILEALPADAASSPDPHELRLNGRNCTC